MIRRPTIAFLCLGLWFAAPALAEPPGDPTAVSPSSGTGPAETPTARLAPTQGFSGDLAALLADRAVYDRLSGLGIDPALLQSY